MAGWVIWLAALAYLGLLFAIAFYADRRAAQGRSMIANPYIYALSLCVYATSWTFYGSVGRAAQTGVGFLPIYLGPTLCAAVWWLVLRKMVRISKAYRITSIADFIGWRYGKSGGLAAVVTVVAIIGVVPYIALQLKAVSSSFTIMLDMPTHAPQGISGLQQVTHDTAFYVALLLGAFSILFGARHLDATERHEGMVAAVAFESLIKLAAFLAVGVFVTYGMYDGMADIFARAARHPELERLMTLNAETGSYEGWVSLVSVSMLAFLCLPRQFLIGVVENVSEQHIRQATWLFPLYMLLINVFVLPIAFGGMMRFPSGTVDADAFVLTLPLVEGHAGLALFVFIGGLSACTAMIIVETLALSTMICNDLVMPALLRSRALKLQARSDISGLLLGIRRGSILLLLLLGYGYYRAAGESHALVAIGLVSFAAVAQFAPAMLIGMYWKQGTSKGAGAGLLLGFGVWFYTMLLPSFAESGWLSPSFIDDGPFGIQLLRPRELLGLHADSMTQSLFWSLFVNVFGYVAVSLATRPSPHERAQALLFVDAFRVADKSATLRRGSASVDDLKTLLRRFVGRARSDEAFAEYAVSHGRATIAEIEPDGDFVHFVETLLAGSIGTASARVMVGTVVREAPLHNDDVLSILDEASQVIAYSRQLETKSQELERAGAEIAAANERLRALDRVKDDVLSTVTHELRTPLASIRALSEILLEAPDMSAEQRTRFLVIVVKEAERLTRLVNQVLDLAKVKAGRMTWHISDVEMSGVIDEAVASMRHLIREQQVELHLDLQPGLPSVRADRDRLLQVLLNLLSNAVKFRNATDGRVRIVLRGNAGGVRVEVWDNGPGILPQDRELVFERFAQLTDPVAGKPEGTGLGLAISKHIIHHFGGELSVDEAPGGGSRFTFTVPYAGAPTQARQSSSVGGEFVEQTLRSV